MWIFAVVFAVVLIAADQFTKSIAFTKLKPIGSVTVLNNIFDLTYVENRGAAFGILQDGRWFFVILTSIVIGLIIYYYRKLPNEKPYSYVKFSLVLICSGAIGNYIDRLLNGYVVDFFHFRLIEFPVFNLADIYVVIGTLTFSVILLFFIPANSPNFPNLTNPLNPLNSEDEEKGEKNDF